MSKKTKQIRQREIEAGLEPTQRHRIFLWFYLIVNAAFLAWLISYIVDVSNGVSDCAGQYSDACQAGTEIGGTIGVGLIIGLWVAFAVIFGIGRLIVVGHRNNKRMNGLMLILATNNHPAQGR